jgi:hypothetical protein
MNACTKEGALAIIRAYPHERMKALDQEGIAYTATITMKSVSIQVLS